MNKIIYFGVISFLILQIGIFGFGGFDEISGVTYYEQSSKVIQVQVEVRLKLFTDQFTVDLSEDIVSIDTGSIKFSPLGGVSEPIFWTMTKFSRSADTSFSNLMNEASRGTPLDTDITLNMLLTSGETVRSMVCIGAIPTSWSYGDLELSGGGGNLITETLVVKCQRVDIT